MSKPEEDKFFSLLVNISASNESNLERLSTALKVFVKKYFDNKDFTEPLDPLEVALHCIMKIEALLYTVYELQEKAVSSEEKMELLYYKDLVLKSLVVLTNLDFFVKALRENNLFKDAYELREKVKSEFRIEAAGLNISVDEGISFDKISHKAFKDIKPKDYHRPKNKITDKTEENDKDEEASKNSDSENIISTHSENSNSVVRNKEFSPLGDLKKKIKEKPKKREKAVDKDGKKVLRTAMGWEIPEDFFEKGIYSE